MQSTPVLHIDISDDFKQNQFILSSQIEEIKLNNANNVNKINNLENELKSKNNEVKLEL